MGFTVEDINKMTRNAIKAAFISDAEKEMLLAKLGAVRACQGNCVSNL